LHLALREPKALVTVSSGRAGFPSKTERSLWARTEAWLDALEMKGSRRIMDERVIPLS
jgi:hypothetical protein